MGRRGPKKMQGKKREPNGQLSRRPAEAQQRHLAGLDLAERETLSTGLLARERVLGIKPAQVRDQKAGSAIGRLCLQGQVTQPQYDAAMLYIESHNRCLRSIDAPPSPGAVDLNATHGRAVSTENVRRLAAWLEAHRDAEKAIQEKQNETRLVGNLFGALHLVLFRDVWFDHLLGDVRTALNALVKHYGLMARAA